ncbi:MAG: hypothetical protein IPM97_08650, partial [Bdellovibrionaceae bacterium]|nr:hypothetical protein [Pseudobdellovibrionaceae bacterium]
MLSSIFSPFSLESPRWGFDSNDRLDLDDCVTLGVFALIVVISVMNGFHGSIRGRLLAAEPHVVVAGTQLLSGAAQGVLNPVCNLQ